MEGMIVNPHAVANALVFSVLGLGMLAISFIVFDKLTPGHLWKHIVEDQNVALAITASAFVISMSIIIAMSIRG